MFVSATIVVERNDEEIELTVDGEYNPGVSGGISDVEIDDVYLEDESWEDSLTDEEETIVKKALMESARTQGYSLDYEDDDESDPEYDFDSSEDGD